MLMTKSNLLKILFFFLIFLPAIIFTKENHFSQIDLTTKDFYIRTGFDKKWIKKLPSKKEVKNWKLIKGLNIKEGTGNRTIRIIDLDFKNIPKRSFLSFKDFEEKTFTFLTSFHLSKNELKSIHSLGMYLGSIGQNWAIYLNEKLIEKQIYLDENGKINKNRFIRDLVVDFNIKYLKAGKNILAFKIIGNVGNTGTGFYIGQPQIINEFKILLNMKSEKIALILLSLYFFLGLYHILLFSRRPQDLYNLFFGLFSVLIAVYFFTRTNTIFDTILNSFLITKIEFIVLFTLLPLIMAFLDSLFFKKLNIVTKIYSTWSLLLIFIVLLASANINDDILRIWQSTALLPLLYIIFQMGKTTIKEIKINYNLLEKKSKIIKFFISIKDTILHSVPGNLFIGMIIIIFSTIFDILDSMFFATGIAFVKYGFFIFVMGIAVVLANRFLTVHNQVEELNESLERKVEDRTKELQKTLNEVQGLKQQQDGDYFLTTLLIQPLGVNQVKGKNVKIDFLLKQKKQFQFKKWKSEIGGDICISHNIKLKDRDYTVFLNADAMGKSIQGGGGALVLGSVFQSMAERTKLSTEAQNHYPERWLKNSIFELHNVFLGFDGSMYISLVLGLIDNNNGMVYFVNAEHPWSILYRSGKAEFIEEELVMRKLGTPGLEQMFKVQTFRMQDKDVIILGSDGRDDLQTGIDSDGLRIINEDETLILRRIEEAQSNLAEIHKGLVDFGDLTDDLSLLRLEYKAPKTKKITKKSISIINDKIKEIKISIEQNDKHKQLELCRSLNKMNIKDPEILNTLVKLSHKAKCYNESAHFAEEYNLVNPNEKDMLYMASYFYKLSGNYGKAIDLGERIFLREPENIKNLINLANSYANHKKYERSYELLNKVFAIDSEEEKAKNLLKKIKDKEEKEIPQLH